MTIKEIANLAGVSVSTVSKIVNNKADNINIETRNHVLKIVKEYNYTPYGSLKKASTQKTFLIGILIKKASANNHMLNGIIHCAQKYGYTALICDSMGDSDKELKHITALCKHKIDGVIWEPVSDKSLDHEHYFKEQEIKISYINSNHSKKAYSINFAQMGYIATSKLLEYSHTNVACLMKPDSFRSDMVFEGFRKCLFDNKIPFSESMKLYITDKHLESKIAYGKYTGIVSTHFESALSLYEKADRLHCYIPSDLSLVSLREDAREAISFPRISSLRIPYEQFGLEICKNLIATCESLKDNDFTFTMPEDLVFDHEDSLDKPFSCRNKKIISVGSINTDITLNVEELPAPGSTTITNSSSISLGGKGANQAVGAAKLEQDVLLIGKTGNDYDSTLIYDTLKKQNVFTQGLRKDSHSITGKAYIFVRHDAESSITLLPGANQNLTPNDISSMEYLFNGCGYCLLSTEIPESTCLQAARIAHTHAVKNILKPAALKRFTTEILKYTDIFVPNKNEASLLCPNGNSIEEQADYFYNQGCPVVIITLGHRGCYLKTENMTQYYPACTSSSTDSTGGADAFISALASYLTIGYDLNSSIKIANYAASFCVSRAGVIPALIDKITLENHIRLVEPSLLNADNKI